MNLCKHITTVQLFLLLWTLSVTGVTVTNIRLVNTIDPTNAREGRLEIQIDNNTAVWGAVCDDKFDRLDAVVACRMLGFTNGGNVDNQFGNDTNLNFLLDDTDCKGGEIDLTQCTSSMTPDCDLAQGDFQVGVACNQNTAQPTPSPVATTTQATQVISGNCQSSNPTVRLLGKQNVDGMGLVEVQNPNTGQWGFVCDDGWDINAAKVVCAQLCYPVNYEAKPGVPAENKVIPTNPNPEIFLDDLRCTGNEPTLQDCAHGNWGDNNCLQGTEELAGVQCVEAVYQQKDPPIPILECKDGLMIARFNLSYDPNLEEKHISVFSGACQDVTKTKTNNFVTIAIPVDKCNTTVQRNGTHIIYTNEVKYDATVIQNTITRVNTYRIGLECSLPVTGKVSQKVEPLTESVTQKSSGFFQFEMEIYRNDSFKNPETTFPVQIPLGEYLNFAVVLEENDPLLKLIVLQCIAKPAGNMQGTTKKDLFIDKCIAEETLSFYPISNFKFGFRFKSFKFVGFAVLYINCDVIVCLASSISSECDRTCNNTKPTAGRKKRSSGSDVMYRTTVSSMSISLYDPHTKDDESGEDNESDLTVENDFKVIIDNDDATTPAPTTASTLNQDNIERASFSPPSFAHNTESMNSEEKSKLRIDGSGFASIKYSIITLLILLLCSRTFI